MRKEQATIADFVLRESREAEPRLVMMRRALHQIPEIGDTLPRTKRYVCDALDALGIPYRQNRGDDGIIAEIKGAKAGKTLAFRADMDGLHVEEETDIPFRSSLPGQMHACGHDAHTAILLCAAEILYTHRSALRGTVRLLFQTGEETGSGAKQMLAEGALDGVDAVCALHVGNLAGNHRKTGDVTVLSGPVSAGKNKFTVTVKGRGTHSAFPEKGVDPILIAARIVNGCEELAARELPAGTPAVLSFGSLQAGVDHNTIPEQAVIKGSIRCQSETYRNFLGDRLTCIAKSISTAFRADCAVELKRGSSTVMNDASLSALVADAVTSVLGESKVITRSDVALMGSDDFANYAERVPGVYFFLHTNNEEKGIVESNHNPRFNIDEDVLADGVAAYVAIALRYLQ